MVQDGGMKEGKKKRTDSKTKDWDPRRTPTSYSKARTNDVTVYINHFHKQVLYLVCFHRKIDQELTT